MIHPDVLGRRTAPVERSWSAKDALLYALGVGAGQDPAQELAFTTENSTGFAQQVLPTFGVVLTGGSVGRLGDFDAAMAVHAEQSMQLHRPLPTDGQALASSVCTGLWDKGSGALVETESTLSDAQTGEVLVTSRSGLFVRGEGGFGGPRGPSVPFAVPGRPPDHEVVYRTRPEQALVYRLSGDRNPLHSDPVVARRVGYPRPILHGLCSYGFAGRALLHAVCGSDPARFVSMTARFSAPTFTGDSLSVAIWLTGPSDAVFTVRRGDGTVVLDRGRASFREPRDGASV